MGEHRGRARRRGVALWPLLTGGLVLLLVVGLLGYLWLGDRLDQRDQARTEACQGGKQELVVAAAPLIAEPLQKAVERWNETTPTVRSECVRARVITAGSAQVYDGLSGNWNPELGPRPTAWVPEHILWRQRLQKAKPELLGDRTESIASSPLRLVLSGPKPTNSEELSWEQLPTLAASDAGTPITGDAPLRLGMPDPAKSAAGMLALRAVAGDTAGIDPHALTDAELEGAPSTALQTLSESSATVSQNTTEGLGSAGEPDGVINVVPAFREELPPEDESAGVQAVRLSGATPRATCPMIGLAGDSVSQVQERANQQLIVFLRQDAQQRVFSQAGFGRALQPSEPVAISVDEALQRLWNQSSG